MTQSDNELVKRIKNGEQSAFKVLYLKYSDLLFAYILHHLDKDKEVASDIWQETWVVFIEKINDFQHKSSIFTWLCAIAKNKISDYYMNAKKQERFKSIEKLHFDIDAEELEIELVDLETQADVITVLANLTDVHRYLLVTKYIENKGIDEISFEIGKSYKATESILTRAREAFRKEFRKIIKS
ncbi:MAG: sigma-70 family RNA polymerase sigma factor [Bacteroidia bacterium]|nr:sigma-70 family RNA polymerase sigma factor [Bacteroidia bacterium]